MPTYEYKCKDCDHRFDIIQKMSDDTLTQCSECKGSLKRLIGSGAGILFKGSGFYQTDYRSEGYKKAAESDKKKTDSKPSDSTSKTKSSTA